MTSTLVADLAGSEPARTAVKDAIEWNGGRVAEDSSERVVGEFEDAATAFAAAADAQRSLDGAGARASLHVDTGAEAAAAKRVLRPALAVFIAVDLLIAGLVIFFVTAQS
jgi:hypothetical protein